MAVPGLTDGAGMQAEVLAVTCCLVATLFFIIFVDGENIGRKS